MRRQCDEALGIHVASRYKLRVGGIGRYQPNQFVGKKIQILFRYTGTTSVSATWEIVKAIVSGKKTTSGIKAISSESQFDAARPYEVFDMSGRRLTGEDATHGIVIIRQDGKTFKKVK